MRELYVSTDIETNGPMVGKHAMLSIGSAVFTADKQLLATFSANLETPSDTEPDERTMAWWSAQSSAWAACRVNLEAPKKAITRYVAWLKELPGNLVFVAYPAAFDFPFVLWYLGHFAGENPFGYSVIDIKTFAMAIMRKPYRECGRASMPNEWFDPCPHTHVALDDAIEQGQLFCNIIRRNLAESS
ncbi:MAG: 3'-5' exoribonuclease [Betaproteobacteria bacterium]|nr:3'-5' exoribonuclease [Betaproteobacteria bacterium]